MASHDRAAVDARLERTLVGALVALLEPLVLQLLLALLLPLRQPAGERRAKRSGLSDRDCSPVSAMPATRAKWAGHVATVRYHVQPIHHKRSAIAPGGTAGTTPGLHAPRNAATILAANKQTRERRGARALSNILGGRGEVRPPRIGAGRSTTPPSGAICERLSSLVVLILGRKVHFDISSSTLRWRSCSIFSRLRLSSMYSLRRMNVVFTGDTPVAGSA